MTAPISHHSASRKPVRPVLTEPPVCPFRACTPDDAVPVGRGWDFEYGTTDQEFTYARCPRCGVHMNTTVPVGAEMLRIYPLNYYAFSDSAGGNKLVTAVRNQLERGKAERYARLVTRPDASVADIGCGDGRLLDLLHRYCPRGWSYAGLEIGPDAAAKARAKGYDVICADLDGADMSDWTNRFDLVLLHQVIEHTRDPRSVMVELASITRPGGILSIETPDTRAWDFSLFSSRYWGGWHVPRHFYVFDKPSLQRLAQETGWEVVLCRSILSPMFWIHSFHNLCVDFARWRRFAGWLTSRSVLALTFATIVELLQTTMFRQSSNQQLILRRRP